MKYLILIFIIGFTACKKGLTYEEILEICPDEPKYVIGNYFLKVPLEIIPHQKTYNKGDTIRFRMLFSDSIYDLNYQRNFKIRDFPFRPIFNLYRIENDDWISGFVKLDNTVIIDSIYDPIYLGSGNIGPFSTSIDLRGNTINEDGTYAFEFQVIMNTPGVYITLVGDIISTLDQHDLLDGLYPQYLIEFEDMCLAPGTPRFSVMTVLEGDPHYFDFTEEVQFLDRVVYHNQIVQSDNINREFWDFAGGARIKADWEGMFAFEVVE